MTLLPDAGLRDLVPDPFSATFSNLPFPDENGIYMESLKQEYDRKDATLGKAVKPQNHNKIDKKKQICYVQLLRTPQNFEGKGPGSERDVSGFSEHGSYQVPVPLRSSLSVIYLFTPKKKSTEGEYRGDRNQGNSFLLRSNKQKHIKEVTKMARGGKKR